MLLGYRWGFLIARAASVPFWCMAIPLFICDRDFGYRESTIAYWVFTWGMFPAFGILEGTCCFVRRLEQPRST